MKWFNLKTNRCPKCNKTLSGYDSKKDLIYCKCGFQIKQDKMKEIVGKILNNELEIELKRGESNLERLNNL